MPNYERKKRAEKYCVVPPAPSPQLSVGRAPCGSLSLSLLTSQRLNNQTLPTNNNTTLLTIRRSLVPAPPRGALLVLAVVADLTASCHTPPQPNDLGPYSASFTEHAQTISSTSLLRQSSHIALPGTHRIVRYKDFFLSLSDSLLSCIIESALSLQQEMRSTTI